MTSGKMRRYELKAREEWKNGLMIRGFPEPTGKQIEAFKMGFAMSWKVILTREKLYKTFNIRWEKDRDRDRDQSPEEKFPEEHLESWQECQKSYILVNNDDITLASIDCYPAKGLRFKCNLTGNCEEIDFHYSEWVDINDIDRLKRGLKKEILEKYIAYKSKDIRYKECYMEFDE